MIKQSHEKHPKQADWPRNSLNARFDPPRAVYNLQFVVWFIVGKWEVTRVVRGSIWNISATCSSESRLCSESMLPGDLFKLNPFLHPLGWGVKQLKQKKKHWIHCETSWCFQCSLTFYTRLHAPRAPVK